eukprot:1192518-Amphidinium_carterae.1
MADISLSFGHGLRGVLPTISGTVDLLSLGEWVGRTFAAAVRPSFQVVATCGGRNRPCARALLPSVVVR